VHKASVSPLCHRVLMKRRTRSKRIACVDVELVEHLSTQQRWHGNWSAHRPSMRVVRQYAYGEVHVQQAHRM
jgi:hypothetical protein